MARYNWKNSKYYNNFDKNRELIVKLNKDGKNLKEIAEIINIPHRVFSEFVKFENMSLKKAFTYNICDDYFDNMCSELQFYLIGYFIADGCITCEEKRRKGTVYSKSYRFSINVSEDDLEVINLFQTHVCNGKPIEHSNNQSGVKFKRKPQVKIRWISKQMFDTFYTYGIVPNKTLNCNFVFPEQWVKSPFFKDLIRGLIDGDGHIGKSNLSVCLNSPLLAEQIISYFKTYENYSGFQLLEKTGKTCKYWILTINGGKLLLNEYLNKCYNTPYYLKRKRDNIEVNLRLRQGVESPQSIGSE